MTTKLPPPFRGRPVPPQTDYPSLPADPVFVQPDPDAPDDREPMPDAMQQGPTVRQTIEIVSLFFRGRRGVLVDGDSPVYYQDDAGRQQIFRPDCYVAFGVDPIAIRRRNGYFIRDVGKAPDFALEIASVSTYRNDLGFKRDLYARLAIGEYWRFDATGEYYPEPLAGETLIEGEYRRLDVHPGADEITRGHSPTLGLDLCWVDGNLQFFDPVQGVYLLDLPGEQAARRAAEAARQAAEARADSAEAEAQRLAEELRQLRG